VTVLLGWFLALGTNAKVNLFHTVLYSNNFIVQPKKRGVKSVTNLFVQPSYTIADIFV
jgi:hypothetical protein